MIWHIVKKDMKLSWHLAAAVAALQWLTIIVVTMMFNGHPAIRNLSIPLLIGGLIARGFLVIAVVHHDAIPGVRQDWLIRPIRRRDLFMAKLLFVLLAVQLPIFIGDLTASIATGFPLSASLIASTQRLFLQMLLLNLPFLALASVTGNLLEVVSGAVLIGLGAAAMIGPAPAALLPTVRTGISWVSLEATGAVLIAGAMLVLALQYFQRRSFLSRFSVGVITVLAALMQFMPWRPAFALQAALSHSLGSASAIALDFDPASGKLQQPAGAVRLDDISLLKGGEEISRIYLPLQLTGQPANSKVISDHADVRLIDATGTVHRLTLGRWTNSTGQVYQPFEIPAALYKQIKDQTVRLEAEESLTLVQLTSAHTLPAINGQARLPGMGVCQTSLNASETSITVNCLQPEPAPNCMAFFLEHAPTGARNPDRFSCGSYAPAMGDPLIPVSVIPYGTSLPFRDLSGFAKYPIDGSRLRESIAVIQVYRAEDHFNRKLVIPEVRLSEWEAESELPSH